MNIVGAEALTFFCTATPEEVTGVVSATVGKPLAATWDRASFSLGGRNVTVNRRLFAPSSEFSRTVNGMQNALRHARHLSSPGVRDAVTAIDACDVMLGVVFAPALEEHDPRSTAVVGWAAECRAFLFDGQFVMNPEMEPVAEITGPS